MQNTNSSETPSAPVRVDIHQKVTDTIIRQLEAGTIPWQRPWQGSDEKLLRIPKNCITTKHYRGINILLLWTAALENGFSSGDWATFKQWQEKKEVIRKGEKGTMIVYYDTLEREVEGEIVEIPFLKSSIVFNRCQLKSFEPKPEKTWEYQPGLWEKIYPLDDFIENTKATIIISGNEACYVPDEDCIYLPDQETFITTETCTATEGYYSVLLHELAHWTGAEKRLNRTKGKKFGDQNYAQEELVAELTSAFLCAEFNITTLDIGNHAAYIDHWLKVLRNNKKCIISSASQASKAVDYLHSLQ